MPANDEAMTLGERRKYVKRVQPRYWLADRAGRGRLLDEMEAVTGLHRKSLLRLLGPGGLERRPRRRERGRTYGHLVDDALRVIRESLDFACAERRTPALLPTARLLARHGEVRLTDELAAQLGRISIASVQRRLTRFVQDTPRLPRKGPERANQANQANQVARQIPMQRLAWDEAEPGHFEVDLVHHSGPVTDGEYLHTLQPVDVATGWSERAAVLGRSQRAIAQGAPGGLPPRAGSPALPRPRAASGQWERILERAPGGHCGVSAGRLPARWRAPPCRRPTFETRLAHTTRNERSGHPR